METLADRIANRRAELGLTQADLAKIAGVSVPAVAQWESGSTKNLKNEHLFLVADYLNVSPRWLATGQGERQAAPGRKAYKTALSRRDAANSPTEKIAWEKAAAGFAKIATVLLLVVPPLIPSPAEAFNISKIVVSHCLNTHCIRRWFMRLSFSCMKLAF